MSVRIWQREEVPRWRDSLRVLWVRCGTSLTRSVSEGWLAALDDFRNWLVRQAA